MIASSAFIAALVPCRHGGHALTSVLLTPLAMFQHGVDNFSIFLRYFSLSVIGFDDIASHVSRKLDAISLLSR